MPVSRYDNQQFKNKAFVVEESFFVNCVLNDCDLFYSGGDFEWVNASFVNCRWHWRGPASQAFRIFQSLGMLKEQAAIPPDIQKLNSKLN